VSVCETEIAPMVKEHKENKMKRPKIQKNTQ
jgi:hypothetical protein